MPTLRPDDYHVGDVASSDEGVDSGKPNDMTLRKDGSYKTNDEEESHEGIGSDASDCYNGDEVEEESDDEVWTYLHNN